MAKPVSLPSWPGGAEVGVSLTFDVDGDPALVGSRPHASGQLSTLSQFRFGLTRGVPRLLELLESSGIRATFYVPGMTAESYPEVIREIAQAGHELGHHGYAHLRPDATTEEGQRAEIERGIASLGEVAGVNPVGYRAPFAELTPETLALLLEHGFAYDSSCMGDDRPYVEEFGDHAILELPIHWSLDDAPYLLLTLDDDGQLQDPRAVMAIWLAEFRAAVKERRHVTYVMHPEVIGRGAPLAALTEFLEVISHEAKVAFVPHAELAGVLVAKGSDIVTR